MLLKVKILKKDWFNFIEAFKDCKVIALDKIFKEQSLLPRYKSPKKIESNKSSRSERYLADAAARITKISTNFFSKHYTITTSINDRTIAGKVIKANIQKESARIIFEIKYCTVSKKLYINTFALVDKDNMKAKSTIVKVKA